MKYLPPSEQDKHKIILMASLYKNLSLLIEKSKQKVISQAKSTVNLLFWQIGKRINDEILNNKRADYGKQIVSNLAGMLSAEYGRSFEEKNLRRMLQFAECFPEKKIVVPLARQLSWSLPPKKKLEEKIHTLLLEARERIKARQLLDKRN